MNEAKSTPTNEKWAVNPNYKREIRANGELIVVCAAPASPEGNIEAETRAELIVRAVNSHSELVDALKKANEMYNHFFSISDDMEGGDEVHDQIRAALTKAEATEQKFKKGRHLRFSCLSSTGHPQQVMKELGITYQYATPQSLGDQWWFWNCENVPEMLPKGITELNIDPMEQIGKGLSIEEAESITNFYKAGA